MTKFEKKLDIGYAFSYKKKTTINSAECGTTARA